ncbi:glycosyltransferase involved in cell wall biosynthesis [Mesobacillus stamsii]|uniref:Glycosyltransferase involved in cell wall biosynthesis n=2 Tax=Mesobacillus stamsii TaxID=225347 RepID=A0ABU0FV66_9BACI|nr:glycosyltransferase involved in cell wall biosynthesis [Mesobacillus stamsii]
MGHIGRFNAQKNHGFLIDIFMEVLKEKPNSVLLLIGTGPLEDDIKKKIEIKNIKEKVFILGQRDDVNDLLQVMDIFVLPSLFEGLGIVLIEAQATGLYCVTSDVVPIEAKVTTNIKFLSLNSSAKDWAKFIIEGHVKPIRNNLAMLTKKSGFDINEEAIRLENVYLDLDI